ncbi:MAG: carbohydrate-binding domain-containing protein [Oscillospiraceae bacterium]|nr:carbohydrate-binding domain-containing protein [Oscillospiraceae bacterium]
MKKHYLIPLLPLTLAVALLCGCAREDAASAETAVTEAPAVQDTAEAAVLSAQSLAVSEDEIVLNGTTASVPEGVSCANGVVTIESAGTYRLTGSLTGQVVVDADGPVELILAGASVTAAQAGECAIEIQSDEDVLLTLEAGTENTLSDRASAANSAASAALYSKGALTIAGSGSLTVTAGANNGIQCKAALTVSSGQVTVTSANHGLKSSGLLTVSGGNITVQCGGDGLCAQAGRLASGDILLTGGNISISAGERGMDSEGTITITGGDVSILSTDDGIRGTNVTVSAGAVVIDAGCDGIQAETLLTIAGGDFQITAGGGGGDASSHAGESFGMGGASGEASGETETASDTSAKGLKSDGDITVSGGTFDLNTSDDSIHCAGLCTIDGGNITICSSDDAIHADDMLVINDGTITVTDCFEGLEAYAIEIHGGDIDLRSVNDGINANGPETMGMGGFGGASGEASGETEDSSTDSISGSSITYYRQTGGSVHLVVTGSMSNVGDGLDSNGSVYIDGGTLIISTDGSTQEGAIDYGGGEFVITGGVVIAGGSSMMQESLSTSSTQCCAVLATNTQAAGTEVTILDEDGSIIASAVMEDTFSCLIISHPDMTVGNVYTVTYGTESTTLDFTSSAVINSSGGFGMGGGMPGGMGGPSF